MKKINVLHAVMSVQNGGAEQVIYNYISNFNSNKYEFTILTHNPRNLEAEEKFKKLGVKIIGMPPKKRGFIRYIYTCYKILKNIEVDIIHIHMNYNSYYMLLIATLAGIKCRIVHSHSCIKSNGIKKIKEDIKKFIINILATDRISCGRLAANYLFYNNPILILNNSIDINKFEFSSINREEMREKLNLNDKICIGHIGRYMTVKNHDFIIEIFENLYNYNNNIKLLLIGDGEEKPRILQKISDKHLEESIICIDSCADVEKYYSAMDIFILPSLYEGVPMVGLEAQCNGLPCIFSDNISDEVQVNENVYFLSLDDLKGWENFINNYEIDIKERVKNSKIFSESRYNIKNNYYILEEFYENIIERK